MDASVIGSFHGSGNMAGSEKIMKMILRTTIFFIERSVFIVIVISLRLCGSNAFKHKKDIKE
jgi:hypothetical protein